jgi:hypothetical protein
LESTGGEQLPRRSGSPKTTSGRNSGETQAELEGKGGTALLDVEAELWWVLAGVEVLWGGRLHGNAEVLCSGARREGGFEDLGLQKRGKCDAREAGEAF